MEKMETKEGFWLYFRKQIYELKNNIKKTWKFEIL